MSAKSIYLVAYYFMRPRGRTQTQNKGWMDNQANIAYDEKVGVTRTLKKADISMAKVILDLSKKTVVRNGWNNNHDFDQLFEYFHKGYPQYTNTIMGELDPDYLKKFEAPPENVPSNEPLALTAPTEEVFEVDTSGVDTRVL